MVTGRIIQRDDPDFPKLSALYREAFPENERLDLERSLDKWTEGNDLIAFYEAEGSAKAFAGFVWMLTKGDLSHILYFAITEEKRGRGLGSEALEALRKLYIGKRIIADVEDPDTACDNAAERRKRIRFYEQAGYHLTDVRYLWQDEFYIMMVSGGELTKEEFEAFWEGDEENAVTYPEESDCGIIEEHGNK